MHGFCCRAASLARPVANLTVVCAIVAASCRARAQSAPAGPQAARQLLTQRGLTSVGHCWLCPAEVRLSGQLDSLERLQRQLHQVEKRLDEQVEDNQQQDQRLTETGQAIETRRKRLAATTDAALKKRLADELSRLTAQQTALRERTLPPDKFAESPAVQRTVIEWINARNALAVIVIGYPETIYRIQTAYTDLQSDPEVRRALKLLGTAEQLGSGRDYAPYRHRLDQARRMVITNWAPLYRQSGRWRTSILLNETRPAACTIVEGTGPLLLPDSVARAAGVSIPADAPTESYEPGDGRRLAVRRLRLAQLRLGSRVLQDVETLVLPPEGEDLGTQLARGSLGGWQMKLEPQRLRLTLEPNASDSLPSTTSVSGPAAPKAAPPNNQHRGGR